MILHVNKPFKFGANLGTAKCPIMGDAYFVGDCKFVESRLEKRRETKVSRHHGGPPETPSIITASRGLRGEGLPLYRAA